MSAPISLVIGGRNLTPAYSELSFSNVDPGGFEQLQVTTTDAKDIDVGDEVTARCGLSIAWHGRVNEIGAKEGEGRTVAQIAAVGYSALLTDKRMQMIYADRDLSQWGASSRARRAATLGLGINLSDPTVRIDPAAGLPTVELGLHLDGVQPIAESIYDAGAGNTIASIYYVFNATNTSAADANWRVFVAVYDDDTLAVGSSSANLHSGVVGASGTFTPATARKIGYISFDYAAALSSGPFVDRICQFHSLAAYGSHGLTKRGSAPEGFYPGDIASHAHTQSGAGFDTVIGDTSGLVVHHSVYRDPVSHEQVIADMARLMGWHWGVWEPKSVIGDDAQYGRGVPQLFFTAPPTAATVAVSRDQIRSLDAPRVRADRLYDTAKVAWQDSAGAHGVQTVTITNPFAVLAGVTGRTLDLDMGIGDATAAAAYGTFALNLALAGARGGGSGEIPDQVAGTDGTRRPACLLRSGRDRIRITDLPDAGPWPETDANRQDSFLVRRVETTVTNGQVSTRIEFDGGADLLEVLGARLALAQATMGG